MVHAYKHVTQVTSLIMINVCLAKILIVIFVREIESAKHVSRDI